MKVSVIGTGYVGLVAAAGFADHGHEVLCTDLDAKKIADLNAGVIPIYEPGLEPMVERNVAAGRLRFSTDNAEAARHGEAIFLAVGTPTGSEDGAPDLRALFAAAEDIGRALDHYAVIVDKSTVPVGTADAVAAKISALTEQAFDVVSNPEFLKEGSAVADFMTPDRVIVGADSPRAHEVMERLYRPFFRKKQRLLTMDLRSAELTKYAANAYLAMRVSYINDIARLCESVGADVEAVRRGMGSDPRIGDSFLYPGCGYGGSCFPKDTRALLHTARTQDLDLPLVAAADSVNEGQKRWLADKVRARLGEDLRARVVTVWGLAFKPNTDDVREAPALVVVRELLEAGATVRVHDPIATENFLAALAPLEVEVHTQAEPALAGADALVLCTEWRQYRGVDFPRLLATMRAANVFDGRNQWDRAEVEAAGGWYSGIGR